MSTNNLMSSSVESIGSSKSTIPLSDASLETHAGDLGWSSGAASTEAGLNFDVLVGIDVRKVRNIFIDFLCLLVLRGLIFLLFFERTNPFLCFLPIGLHEID